MYIRGGDDVVSYKAFLDRLRGLAMQWFLSLPPKSIFNFQELARKFESQFEASKSKRLEVVDLFEIKQQKGETLKKYLTRFNIATLKVDNPD